MQIKLSDSEWKIMEVLWNKAPQTMMQITKALYEETGWSKHTVMTFLKRMEEKKALHYVQGERAKLYYPDIKEQDAVLSETEEFLGRVFHGKLGLLVNTMISSEAVSKEEIEELYRILDEAGRKE